MAFYPASEMAIVVFDSPYALHNTKYNELFSN